MDTGAWSDHVKVPMVLAIIVCRRTLKPATGTGVGSLGMRVEGIVHLSTMLKLPGVIKIFKRDKGGESCGFLLLQIRSIKLGI